MVGWVEELELVEFWVMTGGGEGGIESSCWGGDFRKGEENWGMEDPSNLGFPLKIEAPEADASASMAGWGNDAKVFSSGVQAWSADTEGAAGRPAGEPSEE